MHEAEKGDTTREAQTGEVRKLIKQNRCGRNAYTMSAVVQGSSSSSDRSNTQVS